MRRFGPGEGTDGLRTPALGNQDEAEKDQKKRKQKGGISGTVMVGGSQGQHPPFPDDKKTHKNKGSPAQPVNRHILVVSLFFRNSFPPDVMSSLAGLPSFRPLPSGLQIGLPLEDPGDPEDLLDRRDARQNLLGAVLKEVGHSPAHRFVADLVGV